MLLVRKHNKGVTMIVRAIILSLGMAIGICSIGPLTQGLFYSPHGSAEAYSAIYAAVGLMIVSAALLCVFIRLESRSPIVTARY